MILIGQNLPGARDRGELAVQTGQGGAVHDVGAEQAAVGPAPLMGRGRIFDDSDAKPQVAGHPHGCGDAMIRGQTGHNQLVDPFRPQIRLEVGADEGAVHVLAEDRLARQRLGLRFEGVAGLAFAQGRLRFERSMSDMDDRPSVRTPCFQQLSDVLLGLGIVALAPAWAVEPLLYIDDQQCGVGRERRENLVRSVALL